MSSAIKKVNMISQIVRLRQVVKRWKSKSLRRSSIRCYSSSDDEPAASSRRTPSGCVAVYVGPERWRFVIPTRFLNLPVFMALLNQAEEEFGFQTSGGLALPCEPGFFREIVRLLEKDEKRFSRFGMDEFLKIVLDPGFEFYDPTCCKEPGSSAFTPLLNKV